MKSFYGKFGKLRSTLQRYGYDIDVRQSNMIQCKDHLLHHQAIIVNDNVDDVDDNGISVCYVVTTTKNDKETKYHIRFFVVTDSSTFGYYQMPYLIERMAIINRLVSDLRRIDKRFVD